MSVQAQYPSRFRTAPLDDQQQQQNNSGPLIGLPVSYSVAGNGGMQVLNRALFLDAQTELLPRKRIRDELEYVQIQQQQQPITGTFTGTPSEYKFRKIGEETTRLNNQFNISTSTSGRPFSCSSEIDTIVRLQYEAMRKSLLEMTTKNFRTLLSTMTRRFQKKLLDKQSDLEAAVRRNQELEEKLRVVSSEAQIWCAHAKNNEALVATLRASLEQVLSTSGKGFADEVSQGDLAGAEDEGSCCFDGDDRGRRRTGGGGVGTCRSCGEGEARVLVLPCRHLCLCTDCEPVIGTCPVCNAVKNAGLPVFLS